MRQRRFLSFFLPLFAIFASLSFQVAKAAVVINSSSVYISTNGGATNTTYTDAGFDTAYLGSYDINSAQLVLNGGAITATESGTSNIGSAFIDYTIFDPNGNPVTGGSISLPSTGAASGNRTFSLANANINLVNPVPAAATGYTISVSFRVQFRNGTTGAFSGTVRNDNGGFGYNAIYDVTGTRPNPTSIGLPNNMESTVLINTTGATTPNTTYTASSFNNQNLGSYDINTGKLILNGGTVNTFESGGDAVQSARLLYLIVKPAQNGQPGVAFPQSNIALVQSGTGTAASGGTKRTFANSTALRNLIAGLANSGTGTYTVAITYEAVVLRADGSTFTVRDDNGGNGYRASFTTTGVPILIDTWTGGVSDDWFTASNWDLNVVPTADMNVVIPDFGVGNTKPYPNIYANATYYYGSTFIDNTNKGPALSRDVDLQGSSQAQRSLCRLQKGRWRVMGSFSNLYSSYRQFDGSVIEFAGSGNQAITGGTFTEIELSGAGTKALQGLMTVSTSMTFLAGSGLFTTDISKPTDNFVTLSDRSVAAPNGAQLFGETDSGYLRGYVVTTRNNVQANEVDANGNPDPRTFGNMGCTLLFTGVNNPGDVLVTRNTAESYTPLVGPSGGTSRYGIRRIFGVRPSTTQPLVATMTFRYLDTELNNLGPQGTGTVPEPNLALFVSTSGGNQFGYLGRDALDQTNNILTKTGVRTFATFTLGDRDNPLPVSLTGFDAKRIGTDALVTWQTASEQNNKGFNVQVSTDGKTYRTLGFVASEAPNSTAPKAYTFTDTEKNKAGARYYRLAQVDLDGKSTFFAPRVVTFEGKATEGTTTIAAYPNPLGSEMLYLNLNSSVSGKALVRILDMTGRQVAQRELNVNAGSNDLPIESMSKKTLKVTKQ
ncbi:hypothetical protein [Hymenobacter agri]